MIGKVFINEVLSKSIELYLKYKDKKDSLEYNSFYITAIRTLIYIYGELDIINPYITQNEHNMGGFDSNITKYGFPAPLLDDFKKQFVLFNEAIQNKSKPNVPFIKIEKYLIDMFFYKQKMMNLLSTEEEEFKKYLYIPENINPYIKKDIENFLTNKNILNEYFTSKKFEMHHQFKLEEIKRTTLNEEAYLLMGYKMPDINNLSDNDLEKVNHEVYAFFKVNELDDNKEEVLNKAINYYKRYGNKITTGNGYIDFLLFASVVATAIFITILFMFNYL